MFPGPRASVVPENALPGIVGSKISMLPLTENVRVSLLIPASKRAGSSAAQPLKVALNWFTPSL